ncbi:MAG TPA: UTP--glucose-1-phosphate uridylyltransferase [Opitutaceae bacterium]|jgi:UTP--glucose-1-phosphate uridylyltransferase|nr:UTP--glucose-1-phosphate uridylyltransferase [Opitutaceae bacterium]
MAVKIHHALITAAGPDARRLPLQSLYDRTGSWKPAIAIQIDEILAAGVDHVGVIIRPGDREAYQTVLAGFGGAVTLIEQNEPSGYGHAVLCGREFTQGASFLLQVSDHLYVSGAAESCTRQLLAVAEAETCAVSAVQSTPETQLRYYGTVAGTLLPGRRGVYQIDHVIEKPTPTLAEQTCVVPGLRSGHYLCFFGMHVLTPTVFTLLADEWAAAPGLRLGLSAALSVLATRETYVATELSGRRADLEAPFGVFRAQLALGLNGPARDEVLALLTEELAQDATGRR